MEEKDEKKQKRIVRIKKTALQEPVQPNLVPMVDIMVLLVFFLMLSADMAQRELEDVCLPKAVAVEEDTKNVKNVDPSEEGVNQRININVFHLPNVACPEYEKARKEYFEGKEVTHICRDPSHWAVGIKGKHYQIYGGEGSKGKDWEALKNYIRKEARLKMGKNEKGEPISERRMQIRADVGAPFVLVQEVMMLASLGGQLYKMEFGAAAIKKEKEEVASPK